MEATSNQESIARISSVFNTVENFEDQGNQSYVHDKNGSIFESILKYELGQTEFPEISFADFERHFFVLPDSFKNSYEKLKLALKSVDYIFIHSYGKNGKSTFINYVQNKLYKDTFASDIIPSDDIEVLKKYNIERPIYDFKHDSKIQISRKLKYLVEQFFQRSFNRFNDTTKRLNNSTCKHPLFLLADSIIGEYEVAKQKKKSLNLKIESRALVKVCQLLCSINFNDYNNGNNGAIDIIEKISSCYSEIIPFSENDKLRWTIDFYYFCFNVLLISKIHIAARIGSTDPVVFTFDNLDDVYTFMPEEVALSYTNKLVSSFNNLKSSFPESFKVIKKIGQRELAFSQKAKFVFIYRTSNFLSTLSIRLNQSDSINSRLPNQREEHIQLSTVKSSVGILKKRLSLYMEVCQYLGIAEQYISGKALILEAILKVLHEDNTDENVETDESFEMKSVNNFDMLFRLWNGNKLEFIKELMEMDFSIVCNSILTSSESSKRVKIELYFSYILNHFYNKTIKNNALERSINTAFNDFSNKIEDPRPSLSRLFFSYIYFYRSQSKTHENHNNSYSKGVQLRDFINHVKDLENNNNCLYSSEEIETFLLDTFSFPVDHWGNFYNCCSQTKAEFGTSGEHYKWLDDLHNVIYDRATPKNVSVFYRDAAFYFILYLRRSFEYFAFAEYLRRSKSSMKEYLPVSEQVLKYLTIDDSNSAGFDSLKSRLLRIRERIEKLCNYTVDFYLNMTPPMSLDQFLNSHWNIERQLYHENLISKIIDYLNSLDKWIDRENFSSSYFRALSINNEDKNFKFQRNKLRILLLTEVVSYCNMNEELFTKITFNQESSHLQTPSSMTNTNKSLQSLLKEAEIKIKKLIRNDSKLK